ncbi:hypothetical protein AB9R79_23350, partial [Vibrio splendidus]
IFLLILIITILMIYNKDSKSGIWSIIYITLTLIIALFYSMEHQYGNIEYFVSDESVFMAEEGANQLTELAKSDRLLWFSILEWSSLGDFTTGLFSKLVSLSCIPILVYLIHSINKSNNSSYLALLFCPYILYLSQTALRDVMLFTCTMLMIYLLCQNKFHRKNLFCIVILALCISLLRPFALFIVLGSYFITEYFYYVRGNRLKVKVIKTAISLLCISVLLLVIYFLFKEKIDQYIRTINYLMEEGSMLDESKSAIKPSLSLLYVAYASIRYISTPTPIALIEQLFHGATNFGYVHDTVRIFNQVIMYIMYIYVFCMVKYWRVVIKAIYKNKFFLSYSIFVVVNSLIYAMYYAGGGHSRVKIALFVFVFLICTQLRECKKSV